MARPENITPTETLRLSTTPQVVALLEQLARTGLHGKNPNEVAEELVRLKLREALRSGELTKQKPPRRSAATGEDR
jgi:hypothetical protein